MTYYEEEPNDGAGDVNSVKPTGDGIVLQINRYAMERIEAAATAGVRAEMAARLDKLIEDQIAEVVENKIAEVVGRLAEDAVTRYLMTPRQKTNAWGEPIGGTAVSLSELIPQKVESWLNELVKKDGSRATDHYDRKGAVTRMDWMMSNYVRDELEVATKAAASQVSERAKQVVQAHVGRFVAEQMIPQIEINGAKPR